MPYKKATIRRRTTPVTTVALAAKLAKMKINNKKKTPTKTVTTTNKRRKSSTTRGYGQLATKSVVCGRNLRHNTRGAWKILNANNQSNVYGVLNANRYMANPSVPGNIQLKFSYGGSNASGVNTQPLALHPITCSPQIVGGVITNPIAVYYLRKTDTTTSATPIFGQFTNYQAVNTSAGTNYTQSFPGQVDLLKSVSIKLCLYGTTTRPSRYLIQLVQFKKPYLHPDWINSVQANAGSPGSIIEMQKAAAFYEELTKKFIYNNVSWSDHKQLRDLKVLKSWTEVIQPSSSTERVQTETEASGGINNQMPHSKFLNIYYKFNKVQHYDWDDSLEGGVSTSNANDVVPVYGGANKTDVTWNRRIYLMVRALNPIATFNDQFDSSAQTSYDCGIRLYHSNLG